MSPSIVAVDVGHALACPILTEPRDLTLTVRRHLTLTERDLTLTERDLTLTERDLTLTERDLTLTERDLTLTEPRP